MSKRDYYEVLNLHPECTHLDIKQNFKRLALKWHPDKCYDKSEAQLKFSEINEAYTILSDLRTKQIYDIYGHKGIEFDKDNGNQGVNTQSNFFFQKGFQGTQKSAFEVLQDIFQEKDEDDIFAKSDFFGASNNLKTTLQSFMGDDEQTTQAEAGLSFFETYKPTFMNPDFFMPPPDFESNIADKSYTTSIFSFFSSSSDEQPYSKTSTSFTQNGKTTTTTQETFGNRDGVFKTQETVKGDEMAKHDNDNKYYEQLYTQSSGEPMIINDNDDSDDTISQSPNKDIKLSIKRSSDEIIEELNAQLRDSVSLKSKKISKDRDSLNIRLMNKKPSKKNRS